MPGAEHKLTTPKSASHLFNNVAANGKHVGYVAYTSAIIVSDKDACKGGTAVSNAVVIEAEDSAQIQQIRWVQLQTVELLVMASTKNLMIYNASGDRLMHVVTAAGGDAHDSPPASFRGIGSCTAGHADYICVGVSTGAVCLVPVPDPEGARSGNVAFGDSLLSPTSENPIVDLSAGQVFDDPSRALVCSADAAGAVLVHALEADGTWMHCCAFETGTVDGTPSLCTSARMRGNHLFTAYSTGHIRIYDLVSCTMCVQIAAHARWINALEVHPGGMVFATAAEDTTIQVWDFVDPTKVAHLYSIPVADALLCGVAFCGGNERDTICATAYDQAIVHSWKF